MRSTLTKSICALIFAASFAHAADEYPARAVRIIVPFAPGGGTAHDLPGSDWLWNWNITGR